jgi:hypothetical protein
MNLIFDGRPSDSPLVEMIWRTQSEYAGSFTSSAETHWEMVITRYMGRTNFTLRGPETKATPADFPEGAEFFGIVFKHGVFMPHLPLTSIMNRNDITLPEATNQSFWLLGSAWQFPSYDNADTFVNRMLRDDLLVRDPVVDAILQGYPPQMSLRTLQRRFLQSTGLTYKAMQQIERARKAATLLEQGVPIIDAAYETGFFDQSHLTNSLKRFIGQTPAQIAQLNKPE